MKVEDRQRKACNCSGYSGYLLPTGKLAQCYFCDGTGKHKPMTFDEYQDEAFKTATYPHVGSNIIYPAMGLAGEAGELCDKIKKHWRNKGVKVQRLEALLTQKQVTEITLELGDVLWYINAMCHELGLSLEEVAQMNIKKLQDRRQRDVIKGEGDNR